MILIKNPTLWIDLQAIIQNTKVIVDMCHKNGIKVVGVTKGCSGNSKVAKSMIEGGIDALGDSRIQNIKKYRHLKSPKILLRAPCSEEIHDVVQFCDFSLQSEPIIIKKLLDEAKLQKKQHKIILMMDLGDLREGFYEEIELLETFRKFSISYPLKIAGIGVNFACFGGIIPDMKKMKKLNRIVQKIKNLCKHDVKIISGGNSSSLHLLIQNNNQLSGINQLRIGEGILTGYETAFGKSIQGTSHDAFILFSEIIEIKEKPSIPIGIKHTNAFGEIPEFEDHGILLRAICAIGKQDVDHVFLKPKNPKITILGQSSDHLIIDITQSDISYEIGDFVKFNLYYGGIMHSTTSPYIFRKYVGEKGNT